VSAWTRRSLLLGAALVVATLASCVTGIGYDGEVGVYSPGYIQPYGYEYGGWGPGYAVGPGRGGDRRGPESSHSYHSAPRSRPTPSIPRATRGGGNGTGHR
jgi:squid-like protein/heterogeneous nuclear ribonucleoprotein A1/A3